MITVFIEGVREMNHWRSNSCQLAGRIAARILLALVMIVDAGALAFAQRVPTNAGVAGAAVGSQSPGNTLDNLGSLPSMTLGTTLPTLSPTPIPRTATPVPAAEAVPVDRGARAVPSGQ